MKNLKQIIRFGIVGTANTGFSYSLYFCFLLIGLPYQLANLFALIIGVVFSFITQGKFVFERLDKRCFPRFLLIWALIYAGNIAFIKIMLEQGFDAYYAGAVAILPITILSYLLQRFFVFRLLPKSPALFSNSRSVDL
jgi:putative flippase GtrA